MLKNLSFLFPSLLFFSLLTTSCGWHLANQYGREHTVSVPYVSGDSDGLLTSNLVKEVEKQGAFRYVQDGGSLTLQVEILDTKSENIGYRFDPQKLFDKKHKTIPSETRKKILAKVTLVNSATQAVVLGPAYILSASEFDHQYYNLSHNINRFSLGQLTDIDTTSDVVDIPLYRQLSQDIASYLQNNADLIK